VDAVAVFLVLLALVVGGNALASAAIRRRHPAPGVFLALDGGHLHLRDIGPRDAPPERTVLLLHGASGNHLDLLVPLRPALEARGFRIIAIDRPGLGWSGREHAWRAGSPDGQAALIDRVLETLGVSRCLVLGYSLSGAVASALALDRPRRVAGLLLLCPVTHPWPGGIDWHYRLASLPVIGRVFCWTLVPPVGRLRMRGSVRSVFLPQTAPEDYISATAVPMILRPESFRANARDVAGLFEHVSRRAGTYGRLEMPVSVISGEADITVWPSIHTAGLAREVRDIRVRLLPGVGHMPHHDDPDLIAEELDLLSARCVSASQSTVTAGASS
jgi:pimeloyl-ACP methyl ester carboxylesterase